MDILRINSIPAPFGSRGHSPSRLHISRLMRTLVLPYAISRLCFQTGGFHFVPSTYTPSVIFRGLRSPADIIIEYGTYRVNR